MAISYTGKLNTYNIKLTDLSEKFNAIVEKAEEYPTIFTKSLINPNKGLREDDKSELNLFLQSFCQTAKLEECKGNGGQNNIENQLLLEKIGEFVQDGVVDADSIKGKYISHEEQQAHLSDLIDSALESLKYSKKYPQVGVMNTLVRDFKDATNSLSSEFNKAKKQENQEFGINTKTVRESFSKEFNTAETLAKHWGKKDSTETGLVVRQEEAKVAIYAPKLHQNPRIDSKEAIENLDTKAQYQLTSALGTMQVLYIKKFALNTLIKGVCSLATKGMTFKEQLDDHIAFQDAKYVMANFNAIFKGMDTDFNRDINIAYEQMKDIRVKTDSVNNYDFDQFFAGVTKIITLVGYVEQQYDGLKTDTTSLLSLCPELNLHQGVPLLAIGASHDEL